MLLHIIKKDTDKVEGEIINKSKNGVISSKDQSKVFLFILRNFKYIKIKNKNDNHYDEATKNFERGK
jgi:beta-lactam-binding protein with PASTA domain